jgi:hypothetical protein
MLLGIEAVDHGRGGMMRSADDDLHGGSANITSIPNQERNLNRRLPWGDGELSNVLGNRHVDARFPRATSSPQQISRTLHERAAMTLANASRNRYQTPLHVQGESVNDVTARVFESVWILSTGRKKNS